MSTEGINFTADFSEAIEEIVKMNDLTGAAAEAFRKWTQATVAFNEVQIKGATELKKTDLVLKGLISDTQELTAKLHNEGAGWELVSSKVKEVNIEKSKLKEISRELNNINRQAAADAKNQAAAAEREAAASLKRIQAESSANRRDFQKENSQSVSGVLQANTANVRGQLQGRGQGQATDLSGASQANIAVLTQRLAQLATQSGLSARAFKALFDQVKSGDLSGVQAKYASLVTTIQKYNEEIEKGSKVQRAKAPELPTPNIDKIGSYLNILTRIQSTLTNLALYRGFNVLTSTLIDSVSGAHDLQIELSLIRTLTQDSQQTVEQYGNAVKRVSNDTGLAAKDIAELFYDLASNQTAAGAAIEGVALKAAQLSRVTKSTPQEAGNILSAIANTYGQAAGSIDEQAAKLFKLVDNGRVKLSEVAGSIGKALNTGLELGVDFNQITASLSALTSTGLRTDESMTLLFNIMKSLRNPTKEMSAALLELGYSSGPAAVQTETLFGILQKLKGLAGQGKFDLGSILPDAREQRFFAAFVNDTEKFGRFERDQRNAGPSYQAAQSIRGESDADKIGKGLQVFKNAAISTFGNEVTKLISQFVDLTSKTEDLEKKSTKFFQQVAVGLITITTFKTTMSLLGAVSELQAARNLRLAATTDAATAAQVKNNAAAKGGGGVGAVAAAGPSPLLAGVAVFTSLATAYLSYKSIVTSGNEEIRRSIDALFEQSKEQDISKQLEKAVTEGTKLKEVLKEASQSLSKTLGAGLKDNQKAIDEIQAKLRGGADALKASLSGVATYTNDQLREAEQSLHSLESEQRRIKNNQGSHRDRANDEVYNTLNRFANPGQQLDLITQKYNGLTTKIKQLEADGSTAALQEAEKLYDQKDHLLHEYYGKEADLRYDNFKKDYAQKQAAGQLTGIPGENVFIYDGNNQRKAGNALLAEREQFEKRILVLTEKQKQAKLDELAKLKEAAKAQQLAIKAFEDFSVTDPSGDIKEKYKDKYGKFDRKKASDDFDKVSGDLVKTITPQGTGTQDTFARLGITKQIADNKSLKLAEGERLGQQEKLKESQNNVFENQRKGDALIDKSTVSLGKYNTGAREQLTLLKQLALGLKEAASKAPEAIREVGASGGITEAGLGGDDKRARARIALGIRDTVQPDRDVRNRVNPFYDEIKKEADQVVAEIEQAEKNLKDIQNGSIIDPDAVRKAQDKVSTLISKLRQLIEYNIKNQRTISPPEGFSDTPAGGFRIGNDRSLDEVEGLLNKGKEKFGKSGLDLSKGQELSTQADAIRGVQKASEDAAKSYGNSASALSGLVGGFASVTQAEQKSLDALIKKAQDASDAINKLANPNAVPGGEPERKAYGGPVGEDNQLFYAKGGESVLNRDATRRFYSQIIEMNNVARVPERFSDGGVVTNFGGVKFNISGAQSPRATAREVHSMLKRARRGRSI